MNGTAIETLHCHNHDLPKEATHPKRPIDKSKQEIPKHFRSEEARRYIGVVINTYAPLQDFLEQTIHLCHLLLSLLSLAISIKSKQESLKPARAEGPVNESQSERDINLLFLKPAQCGNSHLSLQPIKPGSVRPLHTSRLIDSQPFPCVTFIKPSIDSGHLAIFEGNCTIELSNLVITHLLSNHYVTI